MKSCTSSPSGIPSEIKDFMGSEIENNKLTQNSCIGNRDEIESRACCSPHGAPPGSEDVGAPGLGCPALPPCSGSSLFLGQATHHLKRWSRCGHMGFNGYDAVS